MPINNRHIAIDNLDIPNQPYPPARPDYRLSGYADPKYQPLGVRTYAFVTGAGIIVAVALAGVLVYIVIKLINYVSYVNDGYASPLDQALLNGVKVAFGVGMIALIVSGVFASIVWVFKLALVRMQNNHPVSVFDIVGGWYNKNSRTYSREALQWYHKEREQWANASVYWSLNTLDLSRAERYDQSVLPGGDIVEGELVPNTALLPALAGNMTMIERLLQAGLINRSGNSLCIGFATPNKPAYAELEDTGFIALAGQPRVGKSATAAFLIAQVMLIPDSIVIVCDKHGKKDDSLLKRLSPVAHRLARTAIASDEIIAAIDFWHEIGANRLLEDTDDGKPKKYPPCFLVIDEFTAMILLSQLPATTIQKLVSAAVEYPKVQTHGLIIGHQWTGKLLGNSLGAPLRRVTTQRIIQRIDPQDAEFLIPPAYAKQCQSLPEGRAIFMGASEPTPIELAIPYMTADDMQYIAKLLPATPAAQIGLISGNVAAVAAVASALESDPLNDLDPAGDPTSAVDLTADELTTDRRARLAKLLLAKQNANGKYTYGYRQVQALTNLRTGTICALAVEIGRAK